LREPSPRGSQKATPTARRGLSALPPERDTLQPEKGRAVVRGKRVSCLRRLVSVMVAAALLGGLVFLISFGGAGRLALGPCVPGREGAAEGASGGAGELLETRNFEASQRAIGDLRDGAVDERLVTTLQTVAEEHRICVDAFKEGHYFLPDVEDGPLIPEGYGKAGALFSKYTRSSPEVPHRVKREDPQARIVIDVEARLLGYFSRAVSLVQPVQTLERFK
jgi:hypothetical protein